jgi:hypothetical protein
VVDGAAPGWYPDPGSSGAVRYWDGTRWTEHTAPSTATPPPVSQVLWGGSTQPAWRPDPPPPDAWTPPPGRPVGTRLSKRGTGTIIGAVTVSVVLVLSALALIGSAARRDNRSGLLVSAPTASPYQPVPGPDGDPELIHYDADAVPVDPPRGALPAALYSVPPGLAVVTPVSATAVVRALWPIRSRAIASQDLNTLSTIETGSALAVDAARGCGCGRNDHFGPAINPTAAVTFSPAFPASFYAEVQTTLNNTPWVASLVFTRDARDKPWRLDFAGGGQPLAGAASLSAYAITPDGFAIFPDLPNTEAAKPLAPALAAYWEDAKHGRTPPPKPQWGNGTLTNQWAREISVNRAGRPNLSNGLVGYYRYAVAPGTTPYIVALSNGSSLACSTIVGQSTFVAPRGKLIMQDTGRENWGRDVPPGHYRAVVVVDDYTPCINYSTAGGYVNVSGVSPPDEVTTVGVP